MTIQLVEYLKHHSFKKLESLDVKIIQSTQYPELYLFSYGMKSPWQEPVFDCRGTILQMQEKNINPVCYPYRKFFNYGEPNAADIDWNNITVYEKLDGTMINLYWYDGEYRVSTTGSPHAGGCVNDQNQTFADLFWRVYKKTYCIEELNCKCGHYKTMMFELMTPENQIVVRHYEPRIVLHGIRDYRWQEIDIYEAKEREGFSFELPRKYEFKTAKDIIKYANTLNGFLQEGFVVVDKNFNRVKIKGKDYVEKHHFVNKLTSLSNLLHIYFTGESSELLTYFPHYENELERIATVLTELTCKAESTYKKLSHHKKTRKEFAIAAQQYEDIFWLLMAQYDGADINTVLMTAPLKRMKEILK